MYFRTRPNRRAIKVLAAAILIFVAALPVRAANDADVATALQFRKAFGLSTDRPAAEALEANPNADRYYSVALNAQERAEIDRRMTIQEKLSPLLAYGRRHADVFGGMHVDQAAGGVVHLGFTAGVDAHRLAAQKLLPPGAQLQVRQVDRTEAQLDQLVDQISRDTALASALGISVHDTGTNIPENTVDVFVEPYSPDVAAAIQGRYGGGVSVLPGSAPQLTACTTRGNCPGPPIMGGVANDWGCTVGFGVNMDGARRFLTAGHCVYQVVSAYGWAGWEWFHQSTSLGLSTDHSWFNYSAADAGAMGNVSTTIHSDRVLFTTQPSWYGMSSVQGVGGDWVGMAVCQSGQKSGFQCGTIQSTNRTPDYGGTHMKWQRLANYFIQVGDSGAPVINGGSRGQAVGLQSGMDGPYLAYFSHIAYVLQPNGANGGIGATLRTADY